MESHLTATRGTWAVPFVLRVWRIRFVIKVRSDDADVVGVDRPPFEHRARMSESAKEMVAGLVLRGKAVAGQRF